MNIFKRVVRIVSYVLLTFCLIGLIFCAVSSDHLDITTYNFVSDKVINQYTYLVISDYHHRSLNFSNGNMIDKLKAQGHVDYVFFTGDMIDTHTSSLDDVYKIFDTANEIADHCYYVTGNHEDYAPLWSELSANLEQHHIQLLDNQASENVYGIADPRSIFHKEVSISERKDYLKKQLNQIQLDPSAFNVLLVHRPEFSDLYAQKGFDLVVSGHTHGGQFRIGNWVPSSIALEDSRFIAGKYQINNTNLVVSRGLGYSAMFPIRVNCNPEIVKITINSN